MGSFEPKIRGKKDQDIISNRSLFHYHINPLLATPAFRDFLISFYKLDLSKRADLATFNLMAYLLPGGHRLPLKHWKDEDEGTEIFVGHEFLRALTGANRDKNFNSGKLLEAFSERYWRLEWTAFEVGKACRMITSVAYPQRVLAALKEDHHRTGHREPLLTLDSWGSRVRPSAVAPVEEIRQALNAVDPRLLQPILDRCHETLRIIEAEKAEGWTEEKKRVQEAHVSATRHCAAPVYTAVESTSRLYASGNNWILLSRKFRSVITKDYWKLDEMQAQLRIAGALWDIDLSPYFEEGSVWKYLLHFLGLKTNNLAVKDDLKTYVYATLYGMHQEALRTVGTEPRKGGRKRIKMRNLRKYAAILLKNPLIKELLAVREREKGKLLAGGLLMDAWGNLHGVREAQLDRNGKEINRKDRCDDAYSIMACVCQSYELAILAPVFEYVRGKDIHIVGLLHDGIFGAGNWEPHLDEIHQIVKERSIALLGIECPLEIQRPQVGTGEIAAAEDEYLLAA